MIKLKDADLEYRDPLKFPILRQKANYGGISRLNFELTLSS